MLLVKLNGIYDVLSSFTILGFIRVPILDRIHLQMIRGNATNAIFKRYFAYWILAYGCMRLSNDPMIIKVSYLLEAACLTNEMATGDIDAAKAAFVVGSSLLLAYAI